MMGVENAMRNFAPLDSPTKDENANINLDIALCEALHSTNIVFFY